jgi:hypothetical protein
MESLAALTQSPKSSSVIGVVVVDGWQVVFFVSRSVVHASTGNL